MNVSNLYSKLSLCWFIFSSIFSVWLEWLIRQEIFVLLQTLVTIRSHSPFFTAKSNKWFTDSDLTLVLKKHKKKLKQICWLKYAKRIYIEKLKSVKIQIFSINRWRDLTNFNEYFFWHFKETYRYNLNIIHQNRLPRSLKHLMKTWWGKILA